jgi:hypothetical protein
MATRRWQMLLSLLFAGLCVLIPLLWTVIHADRDPRLALRGAAVANQASAETEKKNLLLVGMDLWPTRPRVVTDATIISGATEIAFNSSSFAQELFVALWAAGLQVRLAADGPPSQAEVLAVEEIVFVLPARYGGPPWPLLQFMDQELEPLAAAGDPRLADLRIGWLILGYSRADCQATDTAMHALAGRYGFQTGLRAAVPSGIDVEDTYVFLQDCAARLDNEQRGQDLLWAEDDAA